jgi:hypothetical protein
MQIYQSDVLSRVAMLLRQAVAILESGGAQGEMQPPDGGFSPEDLAPYSGNEEDIDGYDDASLDDAGTALNPTPKQKRDPMGVDDSDSDTPTHVRFEAAMKLLPLDTQREIRKMMRLYGRR